MILLKHKCVFVIFFIFYNHLLMTYISFFLLMFSCSFCLSSAQCVEPNWLISICWKSVAEQASHHISAFSGYRSAELVSLPGLFSHFPKKEKLQFLLELVVPSLSLSLFPSPLLFCRFFFFLSSFCHDPGYKLDGLTLSLFLLLLIYSSVELFSW